MLAGVHDLPSMADGSGSCLGWNKPPSQMVTICEELCDQEEVFWSSWPVRLPELLVYETYLGVTEVLLMPT